jgi:FMN phosphatase YigB (HAD superfamily)
MIFLEGVKMIDNICVDLDSTILGPDGKISERAVRALAEMSRGRHTVILLSHNSACKEIATKLGIFEYFDLVIACSKSRSKDDCLRMAGLWVEKSVLFDNATWNIDGFRENGGFGMLVTNYDPAPGRPLVDLYSAWRLLLCSGFLD